MPPDPGHDFRDSSKRWRIAQLQRRGQPSTVISRLLTTISMATLACSAEVLTWQPLPSLPDALGVAGSFAGVASGQLLIAGGANFPAGMPWEGGKKVWHDTIWILDAPDGKWRVAGKLPRPLGYGVSVTHRDSVICVGGSDAERHHAEVFRLRLEGTAVKIESLPSLPISLSGAAGALAGDILYVACGSEAPGEQAATNRAFALDLSVNQPAWQELPAVPGRPRLLAAGGAKDGQFLIFGGAALLKGADGKIARDYLRESWSFERGAWRRLADLPKPSVASASPAPWINQRFLLLGGDDGSLVGFQPLEKHPGFPRDILTYDSARDQWQKAGENPVPRATLPCVDWKGRFVLVSGEARPGVRSPEIWGISAQ